MVLWSATLATHAEGLVVSDGYGYLMRNVACDACSVFSKDWQNVRSAPDKNKSHKRQWKHVWNDNSSVYLQFLAPHCMFGYL
jgi:hypothetical protein